MKIDSIVLRKLLLMYLAYVVFLVGFKMLISMSADRVMNSHDSISGTEAVSVSFTADDKVARAGLTN
jgi:hypothetical protein